MKPCLEAFLRLFFKVLYTTFSWAYDTVAWITSAGQWWTWQSAALHDLPEGDLLELGYGTGHLLLKLAQAGHPSVGLDSSPQMVHHAARRLLRKGYQPRIARALAQHIPFPNDQFSGVLSTFPSEYIFDTDTLTEVWRILQPGGIFTIVGVAQITGRSIPDRFAAWLHRITGQPGERMEGWSEPLVNIGFSANIERVQQSRAIVLRIVATKDISTPVFARSARQA